MKIPIWKRQVLSKIRPTRQEEMKLLEVRIKAAKTAEKFAKGLQVITVGSTAKGTWLRGTNDIDIFVQFPINVPREVLERRGLEIGKKVISALHGKYEIDYAEHPYVRGFARGFIIEIVPCYAVPSAEEIKSAVDRTPFHLQYVNEHLREEQKDDVRLLKSLCHAQGIYGADNRTEGYSGYLCEILIIKHGSFESLMKEAAKWIPGVKIDIENNGKINSTSPIIAIDPVDRNRNAAAAVSAESFTRFVNAAKKFEKKPSASLFFEVKSKTISSSQFKKLEKNRGTKFFVLVFNKPKVVEDTLYPQLRKFTERLHGFLKEDEFYPIRIDFAEDGKKVFILLELETWNLPALRRREGPSVYASRNAEQFRSKYSTAHSLYIENGKWIAEIDRRHRDALSKLKSSLSKNPAKLKALGIPSHVASSLSKGYSILDGRKIPGIMGNNAFSSFLYSYFHKKL